jgi:DNA invertase Pin-like site-specific DNA recombinase
MFLSSMYLLDVKTHATCLDASVRLAEDVTEDTYKGRKPSVDVVKVKELRDSGLGPSAIAKKMGIGRASVYRALC